MRALRILLQIIFGLLAAVSTLLLFNVPQQEHGTILVPLAGSIFIILLLGPAWPNKENIERWTRKWKFDLPTDNPDVAKFVGSYLFCAFCCYRAWDLYTHPAWELLRLEKIVFAIAGSTGVLGWWIVLAAACFVFGAVAQAKYRRADR